MGTWVLLLVVSAWCPIHSYEVAGPYRDAEICKAAKEGAESQGYMPTCVWSDEVDAWVMNDIDNYQRYSGGDGGGQ